MSSHYGGNQLTVAVMLVVAACSLTACADAAGGCPAGAPPLAMTCGLNGRGTPIRVCDGAIVMDSCDDPDTCVDDTLLMGSGDTCGLNGRGVELDRCVAGQPEAFCQDPDVCVFGDTGISDVACGLNGRGRRPQSCGLGQWDVNMLGCIDDDVCVDDDSSSRVCGPNYRGVETQSCVTGQWTISDCVLPGSCLTAGVFDPTLCPAEPPTPVVPANCPDVSASGRITLNVAGEAREFLLYLPPNPSGAPVAFLWHPLGGSASSFSSQTAAASLAANEGLIVVVPEMSYELDLGTITLALWRFLDGEPPDADLALFDDTLGCLYEEHAVDTARVYAAGMSAGGLWTTRLLLDRADVLAAVGILSGGTEEGLALLNLTYETPAAPVPSMIAWGGDSDTLSLTAGFTLDFDAGTEALIQHRLDDGDGLVACDHGQGHSAPAHIIDFTIEYLLAHRWGEPSPYLDAVPPTLASSCVVRMPM